MTSVVAKKPRHSFRPCGEFPPHARPRALYVRTVVLSDCSEFAFDRPALVLACPSIRRCSICTTSSSPRRGRTTCGCRGKPRVYPRTVVTLSFRSERIIWCVSCSFILFLRSSRNEKLRIFAREDGRDYQAWRACDTCGKN